MSDLERTAAISDAHHEGFGHGVAWADEDRTEAITAAEARGYDWAIAKLRAGAVHERDENTSTALWAVYLAGADYLEAVKDQP